MKDKIYDKEKFIVKGIKESSIDNYKNELTSTKRNIKLDLKTWNSLKNLKKTNETFNDVILSLLKERTISLKGKEIGALRYFKKTIFLETQYNNIIVGLEFEYNDVKSEQNNFNLDLKVKKIFFGKKIFNSSEFFGVDSIRKHFNQIYLNLYLKCVFVALEKEFKINSNLFSEENIENISFWKKVYYEFSLSEDSFINDIQEPLEHSEDELNKEIIASIKKSYSNKIWNIIK
jgi:hypothetical protein